MRYGVHPYATQVPRVRHSKARWPVSTKRPRCADCGNEPPACICREEKQ